MKKIFLLILISLISLSALSDDSTTDDALKKKKKKKPKAQVEKVVPTQAVKPCDSKEDILKKLEEKKQEDAKPKAFSLQGGDTGCKTK
jgi:uncharacterized alpha/beta hydrolase family protein